MNGAASPKQPIQIKPLHVMIRHSTDILKYDNPEIVQAIRYIRENTSLGINVSDVLKHIPISRRSLEQKFQEITGHTLGHEIRKVRLEKTRTQLTHTEMTIEQISVSCGFSSTSHLCRTFKQSFGETPLTFRKRSAV